jgi:tetratricopeptide (TPR) repeat protein
MHCPRCRHENEAEANFCSRCGARLREGTAAIDRMIEDFRRRLEDDPDDADARYNLGLAFRVKGDDALAIVELEQARQQSPGVADIEAELAEAYRAVGRMEEARAAAQRALALDPEHERARRVAQQPGD